MRVGCESLITWARFTGPFFERNNMNNSVITLGLGICLAMAVTACDRKQAAKSDTASMPSADTVLVNGQVYTSNEAEPWVSAIAVRGGKTVSYTHLTLPTTSRV